MTTQPTPSLADFKFTCIGQPPTLLERLSNSLSSTVDMDMDSSPPAPPAPLPEVPGSQSIPQRFSCLSFPPLAKSSATVRSADAASSSAAGSGSPDSTSATLGSNLYAPITNAPSTSSLSIPSRQSTIHVTTSEGHAIRTVQLSASPGAPKSAPTVDDPSSFSAPTYTPSADPVVLDGDVYTKLTVLASEQAQWDDLSFCARRFHEEHKEYRRRHEETLRALSRENEQVETVMSITDAAFSRILILKEHHKQRLEEEHQRLKRTISGPERPSVAASASQPASGSSLPATTGQMQHPLATPAVSDSSPTHILTVVQHAQKSGTPAITTTNDNPKHDKAKTPIDVEAEVLIARAHQGSAEREQRELAEAEIQRKQELAEAQARRQQALQDEEEARRQRDMKGEEARKKREIAEAEARKKHELEEIEACKKRELEEAEARKQEELAEQKRQELEEAEAYRKLEQAEARKKEAEEAEAHKQQELAAQRERELAEAEAHQAEYRAKREQFQAKKREDEERAALLRQQQLKEKLEREKKAASEASSKLASGSPCAPTSDVLTLQKPLSPLSTSVGSTNSAKAKNDGLGAASREPPAQQPSAASLSAHNVPSAKPPARAKAKKTDREVKEEAVEAAVKLESESLSPELPELPSPPPAAADSDILALEMAKRPRIDRKRNMSDAQLDSVSPVKVPVPNVENARKRKVPSPNLPAKPLVSLPPPTKLSRPIAARPQEQTILGYSIRDRDRSGLPRSRAKNSAHSHSATNSDPTVPASLVLSAVQTLPPSDTVMGASSAHLWHETARDDTPAQDYTTTTVGDDNGMVNDPRIDYVDSAHAFRSPTPDEVRSARPQRDLSPSARIDTSSARRYGDYWSPQRPQYDEHLSSGRKRPHEEDMGVPYPPVRRARLSGGSTGSQERTERPSLWSGHERARTPPRLAPVTRYPAPIISPLTPPRDVYHVHSPNWGANTVYTQNAWRAPSPAPPSLPDLTYPPPASPQRQLYRESDLGAMHIRTEPAHTPPAVALAALEQDFSNNFIAHDLLSRIRMNDNRVPRQKRTPVVGGRKASNNNNNNNNNRTSSSQPAKRGTGVGRNVSTSRMPRASMGLGLVDRLGISTSNGADANTLQSRISS